MQKVVPFPTLLNTGSFNPDEINMLVSVFEDALRELQLADPNDQAATFIAQRIISLARRGERDPVRLHQHAVLTAFSD